MPQAPGPITTAPPRSISLGWRVRNRLRRALQHRATAPVKTNALPHSALPGTLLDREEAVIAFDVFDTLVQRSIAPEHVKHLALALLARRLGLSPADSTFLYQERRRIEAELCRGNADQHGELEFRHADMATELHRTLKGHGIGPIPDASAFAALLLDCELTVERRVLRAIPGAVAAVTMLRSAHRKIVVVSDFYLPAPALRSLLADCGVHLDGIPLFVSSDNMASKRSGRLYPVVLRTLNLAPSQLLMVGDNAHSDIAMAQAAGCAALQVDARSQHGFYNSDAASVISRARAQAGWQAALGANPGIRGAAASLVLFTERLYAVARQDGIQHLFFLAREGQILLRLFERYQGSLGVSPEDRIQCHYILASRRACYIAALAPLATEDFAMLFRQYRRISLREFLASLRIPDDRAEELAASIGARLDVTEEDFPTSACFARLKSLPAFAAIYEDLRRTQKANFQEYIGNLGVDLARHPLALVDAGWKGTIQDCIASALGDGVTVRGYYLGLLDAGQETATKRGLLFSNVNHVTPGFRVFAENRSLFEILLHADHGSALSYERQMDGSVQPLLEQAPDELDYVMRTVAPVASDVVAAAEALIRCRSESAVPESAWEGFVLRSHAALVFQPWAPSAGWLVQAQHRENFGVFRHSVFGTDRRPGLLARLRWAFGLLRNPRQQLRASFWPALTLYQQGGWLLARLYGWRQCRADLRAFARAS